MKITHILGTVIAAGMLLASACSKDSPSSNDNSGGGTTNCSSVSAQFSANVLPLILTKCSYNSGCHGTGSTNSGGALTNYTQIKARSSNIKSQVNAGLMPQGGSLTSAEKAIITCWVDAGGPNN
jgi:uncharacterized membrane protein